MPIYAARQYTCAIMHAPRMLRHVSLASLLCLTLSACHDEVPAGLRRTPGGSGARVRFDLGHKPLPDIPFPNDAATWPDPTSRTGRRINASLVAPTRMEADARRHFGKLEGWGTFAPIAVAFDSDNKGKLTESAIDLGNIAARHKGDDYDFANDAVYLVNLKTGLPVPLDFGEGNFSVVIGDKGQYWKNDNRRNENNVFFETADETNLGTITKYEAKYDTDFDGHLDVPNLIDPFMCETQPDSLSRDRCVADNLLTWYERETDTLMARPLVPLDQQTEYGVVVTDRVLDNHGKSVRSPFDYVYHPMQEESARRVMNAINRADRKEYFGDIAGTGLDHVAFTWAFTTQPTVEDLLRLRDGLYGQGPFSRFKDQFPPQLDTAQSAGILTLSEIADGAELDPNWKSRPECIRVSGNTTIMPVEPLLEVIPTLLGLVLGMSGPALDTLIEALRNIDYVVFGTYKVPFLLEGGPNSKAPDTTFNLNFKTGEGTVGQDEVSFLLTIPKTTDKFKPPFNVNVFGHGYTINNINALIHAGDMARFGMATFAVNAVHHGLGLSPTIKDLARNVFKNICAGPFSDGLFSNRARDLNGNGVVDSGGDFLSAYVFHTRDVVRQSVLERVQAVRILRSLDGVRKGRDYNGDGVVDLAGDFNADGVVDLGGPNVTIASWGQSLGGILSSVHGAIDPYVDVTTPGSSGGGMGDVGPISSINQVTTPVMLRVMGPLVVGLNPSPYVKDFNSTTRCSAEQVSMRFIAPEVNSVGEAEFACVPKSAFAGGATVVVRNLSNGEVRCARATEAGIFRTGIAANVNHKAMIQIYRGIDQVESYKSCKLLPGAELVHTITKWEAGNYEKGDATGRYATLKCEQDAGCEALNGRMFTVGEGLVFPAEGLGFHRNSPEVRRLVALSQGGVDGADPVSYMPYYAIKPMRGIDGQPMPPRPLMLVNTIGDRGVPIGPAIANARAAGIVPFFRPDQGTRFPEWASYATPQALYDSLGGKTPNQVLIDTHTIEGIPQLRRHPAGATCQPNQKPLSDAACHPKCTSSDDCPSGQSCLKGPNGDNICYATISNRRCKEALYDTDVFDEGTALWSEQESSVPLRLGRLARKTVDGADVNASWAPRLSGVPYSEDATGWNASEPTMALVNAYVVPQGTHTFRNPAPCENWDHGTYFISTVGRFMQTKGRDIYYLSHPKSHLCMADHTCDWSSAGVPLATPSP